MVSSSMYYCLYLDILSNFDMKSYHCLNIYFFIIISDDGSFPYKTKHEQRHRVSLTERFTEADLKTLPELNPPALMQNGNVGTPVKVFLQLIQSCRLPPRLIRKLGLTFPKTSSNRRYGNVPFQYRNSWTLPATEETILTATGHEISGPGSLAAPPSGQRKLADERETMEPDEPQKEEEEDAQSNADDVGWNPFVFICMLHIDALWYRAVWIVITVVFQLLILLAVGWWLVWGVGAPWSFAWWCNESGTKQREAVRGGDRVEVGEGRLRPGFLHRCPVLAGGGRRYAAKPLVIQFSTLARSSWYFVIYAYIIILS